MAMMPREYSRGERLRADDWNRSARALGRHQEAIERMRPAGRALSTGYVPGVHISVHNDTGEALSPRDIAGIKEHTFPDNPDDITISVEVPVAGTHEGKFVIVQESIPIDGIGDAIIVGCSLCTISLIDANHEYAEILDSDVSKLESRAAGSARILWREDPSGSGTEDVLALVEFPLDGPPPVWEATADESSGEITAKRIDSNGDLIGEELTFTVLPESGS